MSSPDVSKNMEQFLTSPRRRNKTNSPSSGTRFHVQSQVQYTLRIKEILTQVVTPSRKPRRWLIRRYNHFRKLNASFIGAPTSMLHSMAKINGEKLEGWDRGLLSSCERFGSGYLTLLFVRSTLPFNEACGLPGSWSNCAVPIEGKWENIQGGCDEIRCRDFTWGHTTNSYTWRFGFAGRLLLLLLVLLGVARLRACFRVLKAAWTLRLVWCCQQSIQLRTSLPRSAQARLTPTLLLLWYALALAWYLVCGITWPNHRRPHALAVYLTKLQEACRPKRLTVIVLMMRMMMWGRLLSEDSHFVHGLRHQIRSSVRSGKIRSGSCVRNTMNNKVAETDSNNRGQKRVNNLRRARRYWMVGLKHCNADVL